ncbi:hypothetical protein M0D21_11485 [Aquimarina sp. D1M17]|uniref:hypothetical protein n=1 Tax=Aquimarina acroporae TaxID=2937283 RepID=UPI0020BF568F|nr:hypothetical protein [Aquimarina acroporae]MCK8522196.1 hypothetical protein [Aquimarina acroporae]
MKKIKCYSLTIIIALLIISCNNEPYDLLLIGKIDAQSELFNSLKNISEEKEEDKEIVCLTFVYPFNIYLYDEESEIVDSRIIGNNLEFIAALEDTDQEGAIGLSYPITSTLENGESVAIENNEELAAAIKACIESEIIANCNNILEEENCVWEVTSLTENAKYEDVIFDFYNDGTGILYTPGNAYRTSWISLFIDEELHVNIKLEGDSDIAEDWNFNWKATIIDDNTIEILNEDQKYRIQRKCNVENSCNYVEFRSCELSNQMEIGEFLLDEYQDCIISLQDNITNPEQLLLSFFETIADAEQDTNPIISSTTYNNITNPQLIFVNIKDTTTDESKIIRIVLFVEACEANDEP